jgi:hypothetical protein
MAEIDNLATKVVIFILLYSVYSSNQKTYDIEYNETDLKQKFYGR